MTTNKIMNVSLGAILLWGVAYSTICAGFPKIYSPFSFTVVLPVLQLFGIFAGHEIPLLLGTLLLPVLFVLWSFHLLKGAEVVPKRSQVAAVLLVIMSAVSLIVGRPYGVEYQGTFHTISMTFFNLIFWTVLFLINRSNTKNASYASNFLFHWVLFAWLAWVAFPWLGELL